MYNGVNASRLMVLAIKPEAFDQVGTSLIYSIEDRVDASPDEFVTFTPYGSYVPVSLSLS